MSTILFQAETYYEEIKKYVIETGHYQYTVDVNDFPLCTSAMANYACSLYFPSCNGTECQSCPLLNTWLDTCLGSFISLSILSSSSSSS